MATVGLHVNNVPSESGPSAGPGSESVDVCEYYGSVTFRGSFFHVAHEPAAHTDRDEMYRALVDTLQQPAACAAFEALLVGPADRVINQSLSKLLIDAVVAAVPPHPSGKFAICDLPAAVRASWQIPFAFEAAGYASVYDFLAAWPDRVLFDEHFVMLV